MTPTLTTTRKDDEVTTNALIEGRDLRKTYRLGGRADVAALRGVDMSIEPRARWWP